MLWHCLLKTPFLPEYMAEMGAICGPFATLSLLLCNAFCNLIANYKWNNDYKSIGKDRVAVLFFFFSILTDVVADEAP